METLTKPYKIPSRPRANVLILRIRRWGRREDWLHKDVHSSSPVRAPRLQLAVEQPSTGGCWNPPTKATHAQGQRRG